MEKVVVVDIQGTEMDGSEGMEREGSGGREKAVNEGRDMDFKEEGTLIREGREEKL